MALIETLPPVKKDFSPSLRVLRVVTSLPSGYYGDTLAKITSKGIRRRDVKLMIGENAPVVVVNQAETRRLYTAIGKIPTVGEMQELSGFIEANLPPSSAEPMAIAIKPLEMQTDIVKRDATREKAGTIERYTYQSPTNLRLAYERQVVQALICDHLGLSDNESTAESQVWNPYDYDQLRITSIRGKMYNNLLSLALTEPDVLPEEVTVSPVIAQVV